MRSFNFLRDVIGSHGQEPEEFSVAEHSEREARFAQAWLETASFDWLGILLNLLAYPPDEFGDPKLTHEQWQLYQADATLLLGRWMKRDHQVLLQVGPMVVTDLRLRQFILEAFWECDDPNSLLYLEPMVSRVAQLPDNEASALVTAIGENTAPNGDLRLLLRKIQDSLTPAQTEAAAEAALYLQDRRFTDQDEE
ncbi:MAG: hypothetical protein H7Z41_08815 [Cytophagales bacterium]|nr:hypothetical protein [Armatimonadota bacterium]